MISQTGIYKKKFWQLARFIQIPIWLIAKSVFFFQIFFFIKMLQTIFGFFSINQKKIKNKNKKISIKNKNKNNVDKYKVKNNSWKKKIISNRFFFLEDFFVIFLYFFFILLKSTY